MTGNFCSVIGNIVVISLSCNYPFIFVLFCFVLFCSCLFLPKVIFSCTVSIFIPYFHTAASPVARKTLTATNCFWPFNVLIGRVCSGCKKLF